MTSIADITSGISAQLAPITGAIDGVLNDIAHWKPIYELTVDGVLLNPIIKDRLGSITLTDKRGLEADELEIVLSDHDGKLSLPTRGAEIRFKGGWSHKGLIDKGVFKVQNIRHSGSPDVLTIRARAADFGGDMTTKKERSFHKTTVGDVLKKIATEHKLTLKITDKLAQAKIDHIDQSNESDLNFITQLAEEYDALCAIKNGYLIFITKGAAATVSGMDIPPVIITRASGDQHDFSVDDTDQYTGVTAKWHDHGKAKKQSVHVKKRAKKADAAKSKGKTSKGKKTNGGEVIEGSKDNVKVLRHTYPNKEAATRAAIAEWKRLQRGCADFSYTLARGDLSIISEAPASISGVKPVIDERMWLIKELTHTLSDAGLVTQMQLESVLMGEFDVSSSE